MSIKTFIIRISFKDKAFIKMFITKVQHKKECVYQNVYHCYDVKWA